MNLLKMKTRVHVAVLCPPGAAVTALLNKFALHGGIFIMSQSIPMQRGNLARSNGQANIEVFPLLVFSIEQEYFEKWMSTKYDEMGMYHMADIMDDKVKTGVN
jgi:hypothetical protein